MHCMFTRQVCLMEDAISLGFGGWLGFYVEYLCEAVHDRT